MVFVSEQCAVSKVTTSVQSAVFRLWHRLTVVFATYLMPCQSC